MEVSGKIKILGAEQQISATFKRELVVTTEEQYPQVLMIEFAQDRGDLLTNYNVGDAVKVSINLAGREWVNPQGETKYFTSLRGWRIEKLQADIPTAGSVPPPTPVEQAFAPATDLKEEEHDDLPF